LLFLFHDQLFVWKLVPETLFPVKCSLQNYETKLKLKVLRLFNTLRCVICVQLWSVDLAWSALTSPSL